jgi:hypothetical protein
MLYLRSDKYWIGIYWLGVSSNEDTINKTTGGRLGADGFVKPCAVSSFTLMDLNCDKFTILQLACRARLQDTVQG